MVSVCWVIGGGTSSVIGDDSLMMHLMYVCVCMCIIADGCGERWWHEMGWDG